ncbi:YjeF family domain-containing protein, variant 2 [Aphanomyces astaci]|uniref:ATP-dependent (S)-NAD(P)H-hydrate dehydratase n=1 Tax=Aphanomyces astaci TaxID=112090 RepID=W4GAB9_APHAT|nr:YjeF family domain-containing protein, variant 2 [Aphanomyces astaci]ETV76600.1 YjeF family domain-containing protein, variant 2 [Aphanomyces astaci]|eukprot:XP_009834145.1 YjeF family domain-containing protein, variant 2 [Aphanomyces astaci]
MDARAIVPPLSFDLYKGQYGKVGIVGGCAEYTDLCHIFCTPDAAIPIKCYSPELIVHPYLGTATLGRITAVLPRLDALVLGPGLGRDPDVLSATKSIVAAATELQLPLVLDGDALYLLSTDVLLLRNYTNAILTPNTMEYGRLCVALGLLISLDLAAAAAISPQRVAAALGHVTVLQKGKIDVISDGYTTVEQPSRGIPRRCGGQGDVLAGSVGAFLAWSACRLNQQPKASLLQHPALSLAAFGGSLLTRQSAAIAFAQHGRSTTTPDILASIRSAFATLFED